MHNPKYERLALVHRDWRDVQAWRYSHNAALIAIPFAWFQSCSNTPHNAKQGKPPELSGTARLEGVELVHNAALSSLLERLIPFPAPLVNTLGREFAGNLTTRE